MLTSVLSKMIPIVQICSSNLTMLPQLESLSKAFLYSVPYCWCMVKDDCYCASMSMSMVMVELPVLGIYYCHFLIAGV